MDEHVLHAVRRWPFERFGVESLQKRCRAAADCVHVRFAIVQVQPDDGLQPQPDARGYAVPVFFELREGVPDVLERHGPVPGFGGKVDLQVPQVPVRQIAATERDVDEFVECGFNVYARGSVVATARGRIMEEATNVMIQFAGVQVRPGDIVVGDKSGVVIIPIEHLDEVIEKAEQLEAKEEAMIKEIKAGVPMLEVDSKFNYERMLK